ncbi:methyltransferase regulatory domain-containing protein [Dickeya sp. CFBP 2040]|uniref:O-linked N-acetylglucosamine transferase family protein n=1 Tax=Dickeya sp. CFBP 2040 TaxID=2718531 RepID=UPI0035303F90
MIISDTSFLVENNSNASDDTDKSLSHTITSPIPYTAPFHLQATSHLYGIRTTAPENARVLEIGCRDGGNLLPFALANPKSQAIGVDLDAESIEKGNSLIKQLDLNNIMLFSVDLQSLMTCELEPFDYIIVHGLFSLIGGETREALLKFCCKHLTPQGIICYSYNTYPGWKTGEILRDAVQLHSSLATDDNMAQSSARAMLTYLSLGTSPDNPQNQALKSFIEQAEKQSDVDFGLHYLQGLNQPCYFVDFYSQIQGIGLAYVGDAQAFTELAAHYGERVAELHQTICPKNITYLRQQYLDFAVNRSQRFSILVPQARMGEVLAEPDLTKLVDYSWAGNFQRMMFDGDTARNAHISGNGETISTDNLIVLSILDSLGEAWPNSLSTEQLIFNTQQPEKEVEDHREKVLEALKHLFLKGINGLYYHLGNNAYSLCSSKVLTALPKLISSQLSFNFWHEAVSLDESDRLFLQQLSSLDENLDDETCRQIWSLRNKGVIWGKTQAWREFLQKAILVTDISQVGNYAPSLVMYSTAVHVGGLIETETSVVNKRNKLQNKNQLNRKFYDEIERTISIGLFSETRTKIEDMISSSPTAISSWYPFVNLCFKMGDIDSAFKIVAKAISINSYSWEFYVHLVMCFWKKNKLHHGITLVKKILRCDKKNGLAWDSLGLLLSVLQNFDSALLCMEKALSLEPENSAFVSHMGMVCHNLGHKDAINYHRKAISLMHDTDMTLFPQYSNFLFGLSHDINITASELLEEHIKYGKRVEAFASRHNSKFSFQLNKDPERPLRIGLVSGDLGNHPVTNFLEPIWNSVDRNEFSLYAYSSFKRKDEKAEALKRTAAGWRDVDQMGDLEMATLINKDEIDILIDLSGHTAYNRLPALALKPAPIQMTWIGYPGTTGMSTMDYILLYKHFIGRGNLESTVIEKPIYIPSVKFFEPNKNSPDVNILPALKNGYLTFASFNRPQKISDETLAFWAKILVALPTSRLIMGYMTGQETINYLRGKLVEFGAKDEQLIFRMRTSLDEYLYMHHEVDILLDTYPYTGGTTIGHASWMGVPVLTREGDSLASKQSAVIMRILGLDEFIAQSDEELISKAQYWNNSLDDLSKIRSSMRSIMAAKINSMDSPSMYFEKAMRKAWQIYCSGDQPRSFSIE